MGHALNNTLQDVLIRWRRMQGYEVLWMPGTDHAGIATQSVVEKEIWKKERKTRHDLGREELLRRIWAWKEKYGSRILEQLKKLGSSCDWARTRFTMDEGLSRAVLEAFVRLYRKGLIYRGRYLVNWCPKLRTALSDDEVDHREIKGHIWYLRYPVTGEPGRFVTVATTRPETMLGDTAVAVHPEDPRYRDLLGKTLTLPLMNRQIPIIADSLVEREFGTGAVKVTPAHDPNDFIMGERHGLEKINILTEDGKINGSGGKYSGLDRFKAREAVVIDLQAEGLLEKVVDHVHQVGHCSRTDDVIEPYLSEQWFVRMKPLAEKAIRATESGRVRFHPERWTDFYLQWLHNVRDWCISRQLWWGHQIPIWYGPGGEIFCAHDEAGARAEAEKQLGSGVVLRRDPDVLDTWFSSALWPFSTLGWPQETPELAYYYPTSTLVTDRGIIFFWVARMVMMGEEMMGREPFSHVYINGTILDKQGRKMSKSLGNGIDPVALIDGGLDENSGNTYKPHGADAVRFSLATLTVEGQDLKLSPEQFAEGQRFLTKLWNAGRFALGHLEGGEESVERSIDPRLLKLEDRWILDRLASAIEETTERLEGFRYCEAAQRVRTFVRDDFCDWYLEAAKFRFALGESPDARVCRGVIAQALDVLLRLLHPVCPFITEEIWSLLGAKLPDRTLTSGAGAAAGSIMVAPWPTVTGHARDPLAVETFSMIQEIVGRVRKIRQERNLSAAQTSEVFLALADGRASERLVAESGIIKSLGNISRLKIGSSLARPEACAVEVLSGLEVIVPLEIADTKKERGALEKEKERLVSYVEREELKLLNPSFREKAPRDVVDSARTRVEEAKAQLKALEQQILRLSDD